MWKKLLVIILLFYLFALLQNSFLAHFGLFGAVPNLVFILFFILAFFSARGGPAFSWEDFFYAAAAGFFLDVFSYTYLGPSIILLIIIGLVFKKIQSLLKNKEDKYPFIYFLFLFLISFLVYSLFFSLYLYLLEPGKIPMNFGIKAIFSTIYNLFIASIFFFIYKKFNEKGLQN